MNILKKFPKLSISLFVLVMLLPSLNIPEVTIMEARNFITAKEMVEDGNWLLTTMNGNPRYEKPPLPTWLSAISGSIFGTTSLFGLRLPGVLMILVLGIFIFKLSQNLNLNQNQNIFSALIAVTSFYIIGILNEAPWDIFAHAFMLISIYYLYCYYQLKKTNAYHLLYFGIFLSFSILSKGPVALYALFLPFILAYGIVYKFKRPLILGIASIIVFTLIGSWWFLYVRFADPASFLAIATKETSNWSNYNVKPFYYYWNFFLQSGLWAIPAFIGLLYPYLKKHVVNQKAYKFTFLWTIFSVILLSFIPEKKARYLVPVLIPLAINTSFYINYVSKSFKNISLLKEKIPVYFHFGILILVCFASPIVLFFILKNRLTSFLPNFLLFIITFYVIGYFLLKFLIKKEIQSAIFTSVLIMLFGLVFGLPLSKGLTKNVTHNELHSIHKYERIKNIKSYSLGEIAPEMLWSYQGKITTITSDNNNFPIEKKFGLLLMKTQTDSLLPILSEKYHITYLESYNLNFGAKEKERLKRDYYLVVKK